MSGIPDRERLQQGRAHIRVAEWLLRAKATASMRSPHFWVLGVLMAGLGYVFYAVLPAFHDVYVILFFYPLLYSAVVYRLRGVVIVWVVFLGLLLSHAFLVPGDPYALARSLLFAVFALLISGLVATQLNYLERQIEAYSEIQSLNDELSGYIERLESTQEQLVQSEKLNALGELAASIAHEINNPLAGALVYTRLVSKKLASDTFDKNETLANLSKIDGAVGHCSNLVRGLLDFARQTEPKLRPVRLGDVVTNALSLVSHQAQMNRIQVDRQEVTPLRLAMADPDQIQQVLMNLMVNAIQAMPEGGRLTLLTFPGEDGTVKISVRDTGCGIPPENMGRIFTPFFTTKAKGKGVGLGLAVSYGIVERHHGKIEVQSEPGKGSTFTVQLPAVPDAGIS